MKQPVGVILTTIILGLVAFCDLLTAAIMLSGAVVGRHAPLGTSAVQPAPPVPSSFLLYFGIAFSLIMALLGAWVIFTIVGLLRLRNWGRISVLIIGGCLAALGGLTALGFVCLLLLQFTSKDAPNLPAHFATFVLAFTAFFYACIAAIGVWWIVYFNRARVKAFFVTPAIDPNDPALDPAYMLPPSKSGRFANVPVAIVIIACLFLVSTVTCAIMAFFPFPAFLFGFILAGPAKFVVYMAFAALTGFIGYGLLHLDNRARLATFACLGAGFLNLGMAMLPWYQSQFRLYNQELLQKLQFPGAPAAPVPDLTYMYVIVGAVFVLIFNAFIVWLLHLHRDAFLRTPPPPTLG